MTTKKDSSQNMIFYGPSGVGKTTLAKIIADQQGYETMVINASMHGNIDTLRVDIKDFVSHMSLTGKGKLVILDEADYLTQATQPALRNFMEEYTRICRFILTCNDVNRIIEPLRSRCITINFSPKRNEVTDMAKRITSQLERILDWEGGEITDDAMKELVIRNFPDMRKMVNQLQFVFIKLPHDRKKIVIEDLDVIDMNDYDALWTALKAKNFQKVRFWIAENLTSSREVFRHVYDHASKKLEKETIPNLIVLLGEYQYKAAVVSDQEINMAAFFTEMMAECKFK